jgi:hypothetical protein
MAIPVDYFQPESFQQANPMLSGIGAAQGLYQQAVQNRYLAPMLAAQLQKSQLTNQIMQPQAQYAPQITQAQLAYQQAQAPYLKAQTQGILSGQIPLQMAQAGLTGTESQMNQFKLNNPSLMLPGIAQNIGGYALLHKMMPGLFGNSQSTAPTPDQSAASNISQGIPTTLPGMPSMGNITSSPQSMPILPKNAYSGVSGSSIPATSQVSQPLGSGEGGLPSVQNMANLLFQSQFAPINKNIAQTGYYNTQAQLAAFRSLPKDIQNQMIAQGRGLGMNPTQTLGYIANGGDLNKLTQNVEQTTGQSITPQYAPSAKALQQAQISTAATSALTDINPIITNALAPYSRQFLGHSPKLVLQEISGQDPDSQAQALAARALSPEISGLRLKAMNAQSGIEAIREVQESSMLGLKNYQGMVSPKVYSMANQYLDNWVARMNNSYNQALVNNTGRINIPPAPSSQTATSSSSGLIRMRAPDGTFFNVPSSNINEAIRRGAMRA